MTNYSLTNLEKERKVGWGKNPHPKISARKANDSYQYHRVRSIRKDILGLVFSSRMELSRNVQSKNPLNKIN